LPLAAYAILAFSTFAASSYTREALFGVGASALLLLFIGIHNAWDATTYNVFTESGKTGEPSDDDEKRGDRDESERT